ncbi:uncharacterized protein LOC134695195 [Mytilus trossulus]|uniref:uncharacterized protein LOC134695195 n=1 Tax=Mytilus trossulus TaxID=6551 RepID=UPI0030062DA4
MWHGSRCVSFHEVANVEDICKAVTDFLSILEVENAVMIEGFYHPVESTNPKLADYSFRLRTNVCRRIDDTPTATQMVCGIGLKKSTNQWRQPYSTFIRNNNANVEHG